MPPVGFEPKISAGERPQTALDRAATGTGESLSYKPKQQEDKSQSSNTIIKYSCSTANKMHQFLKLFILVKHSTCFGRFSTHHQELKTAHTATGICQTAAAASGDEMELEFHLVPASKQVVAAV